MVLLLLCPSLHTQIQIKSVINQSVLLQDFQNTLVRCPILLFVCAVLYVTNFTPFFISSLECAHLSPSTCKPLFMFWHFILCCSSLNCIAHAIPSHNYQLSKDNFDMPRGTVFSMWKLLYSSVGTTLCLPSDLEIALSARMSAPSVDGSPRYAFTLKKKVAVRAAVLCCSISMAAAKISVPGAPTNVAFPPSPIHLLIAFNNDWLSHKYSNGFSISMSQSAGKNTANSGCFKLEPSSSLPTLHCYFLFFLLKLKSACACVRNVVWFQAASIDWINVSLSVGHSPPVTCCLTVLTQ